MTRVANRFAIALVAIAISSCVVSSAAPVKRGDDPEFRAAWKALVAKEVSTQSIQTAARSSYPEKTTLPIEATGNTPRDVCNSVRNRIRYTSDTGDTWQSADESWARRKGDCEDFAIAVRDLCRAKGIFADVYVFYSKTRNVGHAVAIGRSADGLWMSCNGSFERITSLVNACTTIVRHHGWTGESITAYRAIGFGKELVKISLRLVGENRFLSKTVPYSSRLPYNPTGACTSLAFGHNLCAIGKSSR